MTENIATEKQLALLNRLSGKDYSDMELTAKEASRRIAKLIEEKEGTEKPPPSLKEEPDGMSKEEWAERDRIKRISIERQTCLQIAVQMSEAVSTSVDELLSKAERIFQWLSGGNTELHIEIPLRVAVSTEKDIPDEKPEGKPHSFIDTDWLKDSLIILKKKGLKSWSDKDVLSRMKTTYKVKSENILDAARELDQGQAIHFTEKVKEALELA